MAFPITLVNVHIKLDAFPGGGGPGSVQFIGPRARPLLGTSLVPPIDKTVEVGATGEATIGLPPVDAVGWVPQNWRYTVVVRTATGSVYGSLQLFVADTTVELHERLQVDGAATSGVTYATLAQLGAVQSDLDALEATVAPLPAGLTAATATANLARFGAVNATDHGLAGWSFDPAGVQAATVLPTAGIGYVARIPLLTTTVSAICFHFTAGGSALTGAYCALYNDAGAIFGVGAVTNNQASAESNWGTSGYKECVLVTPQAGLPQYSFVRVFWWFTGTTGPQVSRGVNSASVIANAGMASGYRFATAGSGLTTAAPGNIPAMTGGPTAWWVGLKP